jgi:hypothetical protein
VLSVKCEILGGNMKVEFVMTENQAMNIRNTSKFKEHRDEIRIVRLE